MAEFDSSQLSAVSAFFGKTKDAKTNKAVVESATAKGAGSTRRGVGARAPVLKPLVPDVSQTLLKSIGKRRRHDPDHDDDDDHVNHSPDTSDNEDEGRTAIAERPPLKARQTEGSSNDKAVHVKTVKTKTKQGKKERQKRDLVQHEAEAKDMDETTNEQDMVSQPKRKKPKIRSRQKNIRKDNRLAQHKPNHLVLGRATFQGRPLTAETRAKLNLPPSKSSQRPADADEVTKKDHIVSPGMTLAVDDLLDLPEHEHEEKGHTVAKAKKTRASKYKNLA